MPSASCRDRSTGRSRFRSIRISASLALLSLLLLSLSLAADPAFASSLGTALPTGATQAVATQTVAAQTGATQTAGAHAPTSRAPLGGGSSPPAAVQQTIAPVAKAVAQTAQTTVVRAATAAPANASRVVAPASSTVQSTGKTVAPALAAASHTLSKTSAPTLQSVSRTVSETAAPVLKTAAAGAQSTGSTVTPLGGRLAGKIAAPALETATHLAGKIAAPPLKTTVVSPGAIAAGAALPISAQTLRVVTVPALVKTVALTSGGGEQGAKGGTPRPGLTPSSNASLGASAREPSPLAQTAPRLSGDSPSPSQSASLASPTSAGAFPAIKRASMTLTRTPAAAPPLDALRGGAHHGNGRRAGIPAASIHVPTMPAPSPLPGGFSTAMASGAGVAFSIFLILAGLLSLGGLAAMRLLRLASESRRAAQFVLIPERPG